MGHTHKLVSPLMGSEAPCCGGGLSGISKIQLVVYYQCCVLIG